MNNKYYTAIVFFSPFTKKLPFKYRNIRDENNFVNFCKRKLPGSIYFNLYDKNTKYFVKRIWIN